MPTSVPDEFRSVADWDRMIQADPLGTIAAASRLAERSDDPQALVLALWARSRAQLDLGRVAEATASARAALAGLDESVGPHVRDAVVLSSAALLTESGDVDGGLEVLDSLWDQVDDDIGRARIELQRAYILHHAGRLVDALAHLDRGESLFGGEAEARDRNRLHGHRGLVLLQQGRFEEAETDLVVAQRYADESGMSAAAALGVGNRAVLYGRSRRLADAVRAFDEAIERYAAIGSPARHVALIEIDRAEVLMHSGMVLDAVSAARRAVELVEPTGNRVMLGDAQLLAARAELAAGLSSAEISAERAAAVFESSRRPDMVLHAASVAVHARLRSADAIGADDALIEAAPFVERFRSLGWDRQADDLVLERIRLAARTDRVELVRDDIETVRSGATSSQRDVALSGLLAEAIARRADGRPSAAMEAAKRGLGHLDSIVAETTTLEERSAMMRVGADLSNLIIDVAVELGDADTVLAAAEGTRARALHDELSERERHRPLTEDGAVRLRRELMSRLDRRTLIEWVVANGRVHAVVVDASGLRLVDVASVGDVVRARDRVLVQLDVAATDPDGSSVRAERAIGLLDALLLEPLKLPHEGGIVVVPVDLLHGVPWSGMTTLSRRPFALAPNAQLWLEADRRAGTPARSAALVVGPDVAGADTERAAVERSHPSAAIASGAGATAAALASMLTGDGLVHVAAHGRFRSDRPLLSTLLLDGGEVTLHDAVPARVASRLVVLSSCEGGAQGTSDGAEVLGLGAVLLARGAASVIAPLTAVRDLECGEFVAEVHDELARGESAAVALANVRTRWLDDDDLSRWAVASSFSCFGSGASTVGA
ncbi:CHAT domain-containing protein [Ilumatobacter fluminis]|uniref:CHAT domain-containing protein n=1 Tax=Ilumatobacter fluminis TaxID=467091 RepID=A0A4R7HXG0_9ACTN|nr:CHAT domain-containing protein [Ilumatobacter fluminis]TDT15735.1 CHAT domain-containing protein [Ilumatobacter fluminis]